MALLITMKGQPVLVVLHFFCSFITGGATISLAELNESPWIYATDRLPTNENGDPQPRHMATIGNGHIATLIFQPTVHMNGIYNGIKGDSHRAKIPSRNNLRLKPAGGEEPTDRVFVLNMEKGWFEESFTFNGYVVQHRIFAHRYCPSVMVNYMEVTPTEGAGTEISLSIDYDFSSESEDFIFEDTLKYESIYEGMTTCGKTKDVEDPEYQPEPSQVCLIWSTIPSSITANGPKSYTFFAAYAKSMATAEIDFDTVAELLAKGDTEAILKSHTDSWAQVWESGRIVVTGNLELQKVINACFYYLLSSLPITGFTNTDTGEFYGLSPGGLANGEHYTDFQGHNFWDTEIWIFPPILYFFPDTALQLLNYRLFRLQAARDNARNTGFEGVRFAWESGFTGREVTPDCCPLNAQYQLHITADVAFATRQYISATRDLEWLTETLPGYLTHGLGLLNEIAQFWISRITYDPIANQHDILHVMPPDDDHRDVDNCVYTNVVAAYAIFFAKYAACLAKKAGKADVDEIPDDWVRVAQSLKLMQDPVLNYHPEYDGYPAGELIKQADVVLLGFPLMYSMSPEERRNDLLLYGNVTRPNGPAMTWAMHLIGFLELDEIAVADDLFPNTYQPYIRQPFGVWTEAKPPTLGAINYMTGKGAFLQGVVSGYGGLRLHTENMTFCKPRLIKGTTALEFYGLNYLGNTFNLFITNTNVTLQSTLVSSKYPLVLEMDNGSKIEFSDKISLPPYPELTSFALKTSSTKCMMNREEISMDYSGSGNCIRVHSLNQLIARLLLPFAIAVFYQ